MIPTKFTEILNQELISQLSNPQDQMSATRAKHMLEVALMKRGQAGLTKDQIQFHDGRIQASISVLTQLECKVRAIKANTKSAIGQALEAIQPVAAGLLKVGLGVAIEAAAKQVALRV